LQFVLLDQLHGRHEGHGLGHEGDPEDRVERHVRPLHQITCAERALVQHSAIAHRHCHNTWHLLCVSGLTQHLIDVFLGFARDGGTNGRDSANH
jgi:hypothetical protein